jgi:hypothetical protein
MLQKANLLIFLEHVSLIQTWKPLYPYPECRESQLKTKRIQNYSKNRLKVKIFDLLNAFLLFSVYFENSLMGLVLKLITTPHSISIIFLKMFRHH